MGVSVVRLTDLLPEISGHSAVTRVAKKATMEAVCGAGKRPDDTGRW